MVSYLFAEKLLIEKLKNDVPELISVSDAATLSALSNESPATPCAYVVYLGDAVSEHVAGTGGIQRKAQQVTQIWSVVLCVYMNNGGGIGGGVSEASGDLIDAIFNSLCGYIPAPNCSPITRHSTPVAVDYEDNYGYYQINFQVSFVSKYKA